MAGDNFRYPAPYEECRLPTVGIPCKTTVLDPPLNSDGTVPSTGSLIISGGTVLSAGPLIISGGVVTSADLSLTPSITSPHCMSPSILNPVCSPVCPVSVTVNKCDPSEPKATLQDKGKLSSIFKLAFASSPTACGNDRTQRVLGFNEDCSSSDESYIGQSGVIASSRSDEDHPVVLAPLEVGDLLAGLARAISGHGGIDDDWRMSTNLAWTLWPRRL